MARIFELTVRYARSFACHQRGVVAVEFALIIPVMLIIYFGTLEVTNAMTVARRVNSVAQTAADLTAQATSVSTSDINDIFAASTAILNPFNTSPVQIVLSSVATAAGTNVTKVVWSKGYNGGAALSTNSTVVLPTGLAPSGSSVIMAQVTYTYVSPIGQIITGPIVMSETAYLKPRRTVSVGLL